MFEEAGYMVCGQLHLLSELLDIKSSDIDMTLLQVPDVSRLEQLKLTDPICEINTPIIDSKF